MHELGIATEIYRTCRRKMAGRPAGKLETVEVAIGQLAGIEPELLRYAWEAVVQGSPDQGAVLEIDWRPAWEVCGKCGSKPAPESRGWLQLCDQCGQMLHVKGGDELDLLRFTFVPDEEVIDDVHGPRSR